MSSRQATTALLLLDVQRGLIDAVDPALAALGTMRKAASAAREVGLPVIHVGLTLRTTHHDVSPRNRAFCEVANSDLFDEGASSAQPHPGLHLSQNDILVTKRRVSGFAGSDLALVLRSLEIEEVVLAGLTTSGAVLSTFREAADLDFAVVVLRDGCADPHRDLHELMMTVLFPQQGTVLDVADWIATISPTPR